MRSLLSAISKYLPLCRQKSSIQYPQEDLNSTLLNELCVDAVGRDNTRHNSGEADKVGGRHKNTDIEETEDVKDVGSEEEDFVYQWEYEEDIKQQGKDGAEGAGDSCDTGKQLKAEDGQDDEDNLDPENMDGLLEDEYDENGYAPL